MIRIGMPVRFRAWIYETREMKSVTDTMGNLTHYCDTEFSSEHDLLQWTGCLDQNAVPVYIGDICEFDNGDRCIIRRHHYLECYGDWIGEPECDNHLRDLYRVQRAKIIGNIYQNPELITTKNYL